METAVIVDGARTPFGRLGGELAGYQSFDLGAIALEPLIKTIDVNDLDEVIVGVGIVSSGALVPARRLLQEAKLTLETPSVSVDRACCSGLTAIGLAADRLALGRRRVIFAGGMESMTQTPLLLRTSRSGYRLGDQTAEDLLLMKSPLANAPIATYVGEVALTYGVTREIQDEWALRSHERYFAAADKGLTSEEIRCHPVGRSGVPMELDEPPRRNSSLDQLARLKTIYGSPTVTAGNAPGLNDGASMTIMMTETYARSHDFEPLATVVDHVSMAGAPTSSAYLPAHAIQRLLRQNGIHVSDLKVIEINEAFAAVPAVSLRVLADGDPALLASLEARTNVNGGAVAIGHPVGASGARIAYTAVLETRRRGGGYAVASICGGFGQAEAALFRVA